ncbi:hypothetical protein [Curtobacterium sp. MCBD17_030]|uniref:hypothetical protein n=1 Tax=Curtobacterium sp. MCBD17_030 TaxID=2175649 RepID=UPI000D8B75BF|nr:hypothetical protein [Curtobacterium sp. MCBD17_030]PYY32361.1 hypothetical protein DEI89_13075 [Curtobacterium sp. MCBD17_030]
MAENEAPIEATNTEGVNAELKTGETIITQSEVDRIVKERVARERAKYADYDELKAKADGAKTVEQKLADLEGKYSAAEARAIRSDIAAKHGISAEDRDLFLTGTDEATLTAQAERLAAREADRKKNGNVAPKEGTTTTTGGPSKDMREFTRTLFGQTD